MKKPIDDFKCKTQKELQDILQMLTRSKANKLPDKILETLAADYALTPDNLLKMILISLRINSMIPVVIMGETGCGKTSLVRYLAEISDVDFELFSIHAGINAKCILQKIKEVNVKALSSLHTSIWLFLDEINTCDHLGLINSVICHRYIQNKDLAPNLTILAACNPYRMRKHSTIFTSGLQGKVKTDELSRLAYRVHPLPEALIDYVWDYGSLNEKDEQFYISKMVNRVFGVLYNSTVFEPLLTKLLAMSQSFVRAKEETDSCVSLRDVDRCKRLVHWFLQFLQKKRTATGFAYGIETKAIVLALAVCYHSRFENVEVRKAYREKISHIISKEHYPISSEGVLEIIRDEQKNILDRMTLPNGIAKNTALQENVFVVLVCILNKIPIFLVGKPGCSKSLSIQLIRSNLRGKDSKDILFQSMPQLFCVSFQGSESSTSDGIIKVFEKAEKYQQHNEKDVISVVILDEIGLAEISRFNPLKVLHGLLEPGNKQNPNVSVVGISNWALDAAKMNRAIHLSRPDMDLDELKYTGHAISTAMLEEMKIETVWETDDTHENRDISDILAMSFDEIATAYYKYTRERQRFANFHGLRDYYSLIKYVCRCRQLSSRFDQSETDIILNGIARNFGGLPLEMMEIVGIFQESVPNLRHKPIPVTDLIKENLDDNVCRHLMLITNGDAVISVLESHLNDAKRPYEIIFGSHFEDDLSDDYNYQKSVLLLQCSVTLDGQHLLLTKVIIENIRRKCQVKQKHVCMIIHLDRNVGNDQQLVPINFLSGWKIIFIDGLEKPATTIGHFICTSKYDIVKERRPLHEYIVDNLFWAFTRIRFTSENNTIENQRFVIDKLRLSEVAICTIEELILNWIEEQSNDHNQWCLDVAKNSHELYKSGALVQACENSIHDVIKSPLAMFLYRLMELQILSQVFVVDEFLMERTNNWREIVLSKSYTNIEELPPVTGPECYSCSATFLPLKMPLSSLIMNKINLQKDEFIDIIRKIRIQNDIEPYEDIPFDLFEKTVSGCTDLICHDVDDIYSVAYAGRIDDYVHDFCCVNASGIANIKNKQKAMNIFYWALKHFIQPLTFQQEDIVQVIATIHAALWLNSSTISSTCQLVALSEQVIKISWEEPVVETVFEEEGSNFESETFYISNLTRPAFVDSLCLRLLPTAKVIHSYSLPEWMEITQVIVSIAKGVTDESTVMPALQLCQEIINLVLKVDNFKPDSVYLLGELFFENEGQIDSPSVFNLILSILQQLQVESSTDVSKLQQLFCSYVMRGLLSNPSDNDILKLVLTNIAQGDAFDSRLAYFGKCLEFALYVDKSGNEHLLEEIILNQLSEVPPFVECLDSFMKTVDLSNEKSDVLPCLLIDVVQKSFAEDSINTAILFQIESASHNSIRCFLQACDVLDSKTLTFRYITAVAFLKQFVQTYYIAIEQCKFDTSKMPIVSHHVNTVVSTIWKAGNEDLPNPLLVYLMKYFAHLHGIELIQRSCKQVRNSLTSLQSIDWNMNYIESSVVLNPLAAHIDFELANKLMQQIDSVLEKENKLHDLLENERTVVTTFLGILSKRFYMQKCLKELTDQEHRMTTAICRIVDESKLPQTCKNISRYLLGNDFDNELFSLSVASESPHPHLVSIVLHLCCLLSLETNMQIANRWQVIRDFKISQYEINQKTPCIEAYIEELIEPTDAVGIDKVIFRLFRISHPPTKDIFINELCSGETQQFAFLHLVFKNTDRLTVPQFLPALLRWHMSVIAYASYKFKKVDFRDLSVQKFLSQETDDSRRDVLKKYFEQFKKAWNEIKDNYCDVMANTVISRMQQMNTTVKMENCTVWNDESTLLLLLQELVQIHNAFLDQSNDILGHKQRQKKFKLIQQVVALLDVKSNEIVTFKWNDNWLKFCQSDTSYGLGQRLLFDYEKIEEEVKKDILIGKMKIEFPTRFPKPVFTDDLYKNSVELLSDLEKSIPQQQLTKEIRRSVEVKVDRDAAFVTDLLTQLGMILALLKKTGGDNSQPLIEYLEKWQSVTGMNSNIFKRILPEPVDSVKLGHVVTLYKWLEELNGRSLVEALDERFHRTLHPEAKEILHQTKNSHMAHLEKLQHPLLVFVHRCLALRNTISHDHPLVEYISSHELWWKEHIRKQEGTVGVIAGADNICISISDILSPLILIENICETVLFVQEAIKEVTEFNVRISNITNDYQKTKTIQTKTRKSAAKRFFKM
ncbi:hypothetical protein AM593_05709, partial [Mytilus galloprovincialis]